MGSYLGDLSDDIGDYIEDFLDHFKKPGKAHKKLKKKTEKTGRPYNAFAERVKGIFYLILGATVIYSAFIATTEGISGVREVARILINSLFGRIIVLVIGAAYVIHGVWKIVCGGD